MNWIADNLIIYDYGGIKLLLNNQASVDHTIIRDSYWEKGEIDFLATLWPYGSGKRKIFFDIGANLGLYSLNAWMSHRFDEIYAFEADAYNFSQLQTQILLNEATGIKAHNLAVSDHVGTVNIAYGLDIQDNRGATSILEQGDKEIACTSLDLMFPDLTDAMIFAKIDDEGHELTVLRGMRDIIKNNEVAIQIECYIHEGRYDFLDEYWLSQINEIYPDIFGVNVPELYIAPP